MNDFHLFSIHIANKDINKAMLILRDKPESIARKIMIKARVKVPAYTGKTFWAWAQKYIIETCRAVQENINVQPKHNTIQNVPLGHNRAKSGDTGLDKTPCVPDNAARSLQHDIPEPSPAGVVCRRENGVPSVHPGLGDKRAEETGVVSGKPPKFCGLLFLVIFRNLNYAISNTLSQSLHPFRKAKISRILQADVVHL